MKITGKRQLFLGIVIGVLISGVTVAVASIPDSRNQVISGCYSTRNGALRVIDFQAGRRCATGEVLLQWNQRGLQGATGLTGAQGPQGVQGPAGQAAVGYVHSRTAGQDTVQLFSGPITARIASLTLPPGNYMVTAKVVIQSNHVDAAVTVFCSIRPGLGDHIDFSQSTVMFFSTSAQTMVMTGGVEIVSEIDVDLLCDAMPAAPAPPGTHLATAVSVKISAVKVAELNFSSEP